MKKNMNRIGVLILIVIFALFYLIANFFLEKRNINKNTEVFKEPLTITENNYENEKAIVENLYKEVRIIYDVVNNKFRVDQDTTITIGDVIYKKIINFDEIMNTNFTENGIKKYIDDMGSYFAYTEDGYYLAGNLISYQTYYFRGDSTNIFITGSTENKIDGIIYEKWTSNNKNTLATITVVKENEKWLIDKIDILSKE